MASDTVRIVQFSHWDHYCLEAVYNMYAYPLYYINYVFSNMAIKTKISYHENCQ